MPAFGTPIFDALALTTIEVDLIEKNLTAKAAFVNTRTGHSHGWTEGSGTIWSEETKVAVAALAASMERDLAKLHFGATSEPQVAAPGTQLGTLPVSGIGEHLSDGDGTRSV